MNKARLAALSETELIDAVCECNARNSTTHPDIASLLTELGARRGIHKRKQMHKPGEGTGPKKPAPAAPKKKPVFGTIGGEGD